MRTYVLALVFVAACLTPSILLISGYRLPAEPTAAASKIEPERAANPILAPKETVVAESDSPIKNETALPADAVPQAQNPLIRGMRQMLQQTFNSSELDDERGQLDQSLIEADSLLSKAKRSNRDALRQANRQVRIRGPQSPNIVLILADDVRQSDLNCYGQSSAKTPNIDRLAANGIRFNNFHAGSSVASASRWTLMTGLQTSHAAQKSDASIALRNEEITLAEMLWQGGYSTGAIGLWGLPSESANSVPNDHGFEEWLGLRDAREANEEFPAQLWSDRGRVKVIANADGKQGATSSVLFTQEAISFIERRHQERPFFLLLSYPSVAEHGEQKDRADAISKLDAHIGQLRDRLVALDIDENTIVILTSDVDSSKSHGEMRLPLIIDWPNQGTAGRVSDFRCAMWDLYPTLADIVDVHRFPTWVDGKSLYRELVNEK